MAVTLRDIARKLDISVTTVSRALAGYDDVAVATREKVVATAEEMGYSPNITAQRLQKQRTDTLGFIMPTFGPRFSDPFFSEFIAGIGNESAAHRYDLLVSTHAPDSDEERAAYRRAAHGGWVDGLIVVRTRENDDRIQTLCEVGFPFVAFGRTECEHDFSFVDEDSEEGMRLIVQHFIDQGHRRIAFIAPPPGLMFGHYRLNGYRRTMAANKLETSPQWIVSGDMTHQGGANAIEALVKLRPRPTAVICGNDLMALGAMSRMRQKGITVGVDMAVGGFDDIPLAAFANPPLTTVRQPIYEIGRRTCALLIGMLNGRGKQRDHVLLTPSLVVRASSGPQFESHQEEVAYRQEK